MTYRSPRIFLRSVFLFGAIRIHLSLCQAAFQSFSVTHFSFEGGVLAVESFADSERAVLKTWRRSDVNARIFTTTPMPGNAAIPWIGY